MVNIGDIPAWEDEFLRELAYTLEGTLLVIANTDVDRSFIEDRQKYIRDTFTKESLRRCIQERRYFIEEAYDEFQDLDLDQDPEVISIDADNILYCWILLPDVPLFEITPASVEANYEPINRKTADYESVIEELGMI